MSYLTQEEIDALQTSKLPTNAPFAICSVSQSQFSIARHYGGIKFNGFPYTYIQPSDELVRDDVMKFIGKRRKQAKKTK